MSKIQSLQAEKAALSALKSTAAQNKSNKEQAKPGEDNVGDLVSGVVKVAVALVKAVLTLALNIVNAANGAFGKEMDQFIDKHGQDSDLMSDPDAIDAKIKDIDKQIAEEIEKGQKESDQEVEERNGVMGAMVKAASIFGKKFFGLGGGDKLKEENESDKAKSEEEKVREEEKAREEAAKREEEKAKSGEEKAKSGEESVFTEMAKGVGSLIGDLFNKDGGEKSQEKENGGFMTSLDDINSALKSSFDDLDKERSKEEKSNPIQAALREAMGDVNNNAASDSKATNVPSQKEPSESKGATI